jgi:hypothetical protein
MNEGDSKSGGRKWNIAWRVKENEKKKGRMVGMND